MSLKSAKEVGIPIPGESSVRRGTLLWLDKVATGQDKGLARYQPWEPVTATMTAEAWVCRQFLGVGGPGAASTEAAEHLLRNESDRGPSNVYYWYYATLALYQHGGQPWSRWNALIRDRIVGLQRTSGHQTGSWDPDGSHVSAPRGAASTALPWPRSRWKSTIATCGSMTSPRSPSKPAQLHPARSKRAGRRFPPRPEATSKTADDAKGHEVGPWTPLSRRSGSPAHETHRAPRELSARRLPRRCGRALRPRKDGLFSARGRALRRP